MVQNKINRRRFIKNTAIGGASMMFLPELLSAGSIILSSNQQGTPSLPPITVISLIEDSCMLAFRAGNLSTTAQTAATSDVHVRLPGNKGRLAGALPPEDKRLLELLSLLKNNPEIDLYAHRLAIAYGWACVNAASRNLSGFLAGKPASDMVNILVNLDAVVIREQSIPYSDPGLARVSDVEEMLHVILPRALTRVHTLKPDVDDGINWVNRMADWRREIKQTLSLYAGAIVSPDQRFLPEHFYQRDDAIIFAARELFRAKDVKPDAIFEAASISGQTSIYAKALIESFYSILVINEYLSNKISDKEIEYKLFG